MRVYIAGPIAGRPDGNRAEFARTAAWLAGLGHAPINPHDVTPRKHDGDCPVGASTVAEGGTHTAPCYMRADMLAMLTCDAIYLLDGWELSSGAVAEFLASRSCGLSVWFQGESFPCVIRDESPCSLGMHAQAVGR